ncbi:hypothetical protein GH810_14330 [Acetobacterium paludosum]|uniref:Uncharacterized protein n=1 Tax=Acetobacterium paludosum TaxID=52693 RepID=A0A923KQU1_9FIRM|nr:hypothetical protein [Acetobacterium paludosum]MBC3889489.1 hypothetical protein [Acetobacterium paludosum]
MKAYKITMTEKSGIKSSYTKTYEQLGEFEKELLANGGHLYGSYFEYCIAEIDTEEVQK